MDAQEIYTATQRIVKELGVDFYAQHTDEEIMHAIAMGQDVSTYTSPAGRTFSRQGLQLYVYTTGSKATLIRCGGKELLPFDPSRPAENSLVFICSGTDFSQVYLVHGPWEDMLADTLRHIPEIKQRRIEHQQQLQAEAERKEAQARAESDEREQVLAIARKIGDALAPLGEWHCDSHILLHQDGAGNTIVHERYQAYRHALYSVRKVLDTRFATPVAIRGDWVNHALDVVEKKLRHESYEYFPPNGLRYSVYWAKFN